MDQLFLLKPGFVDAAVDRQGKKYYCPYCATIEGVLSYYPELRKELEIRHVDFPRPRKEITDLLGEAYQGCPVLVIDEGRSETIAADSLKEVNGRRFINSSADILDYLAKVYNVGIPHP